jgi:molybdopterin-guanine dinucleotide biosynthesis protein A
VSAALAGVVLCGGQSTRMGTPKAWLAAGGETLLARTVRAVAAAASPVVVVAAPGQEVPPLPEGVTVIRDAVAGRGPLEGLAAGLDAVASFAPAAFVSATDAPFLHPALIRRLAELRGPGDDIVVPRAGGRLHPLAAVWAEGARAEIAASLAAGQLRLTGVVARARARYADEALLLAGEELARVDPGLRSLCNVNTPEEYAAVLAEMAGSAR